MIGKTISHYEIVEKLGQGGMGVVYKARDLRLSRFVALKMLSPEVAFDSMRKKRLMREARAASALNHPNICTIHEIDEVDNTLFVVMEFLPGNTLGQEISRGPLSLQRVLEVTSQVADALEIAHSSNIVHRDIKPSNILITPDGRVKILDFGLAHMEMENEPKSEPTTLEERLTQTGQIVGTVPFMSPEQLKGSPPNARTDLFSFGVVLYAMLTGKLPFEGSSIYQIISSIVNNPPPPVTQWNSVLPPELNRILAKALAKNPKDRYASVKDLLTDLQKCLTKDSADQMPTQTSDLSAIPQTTKMRRQVTVAVSQINGYAEMIESLSSAEAQAFLQTMQDNLKEIVKRQEGIVSDFSGDRIVVLCGIPTAHEDDALCAMRAVLEMHSKIRELSSEVERRIQRPLSLQSGITCGVAVAEVMYEPELKCNITGSVLQLATRLATEAEEDQILISPECLRLIDPYFETEPLESIRIKGKGSPIVPYRVLKESGVQSRLEASARTGFTAFTGREKELQTLQSVWKRAQQNEGHLVTIFGEAGVGKSRLLLEFVNQVKSGAVLILHGRCQSHRSKIPYVPFVEALRELLELHDSDSISAETAVARILQIDPGLEAFLPIYLYLLSIKSEHHVLPQLQPEDLRLAVREALSAIFIIKASKIATVLQLEDWHWADDASQDVLKNLVEMIRSSAVLILLGSRPDMAVNIGNFVNHVSIHLTPMDEALSMRIIESALAVDQFPENFGKIIYDRTSGNPFFLEEICHTLQEEGKIRIANRKVVAISPMSEFRLPETVEAVIQARIDRLVAEDQELLRRASVAGREFTRGVLQQIAEDNSQIMRSLENLRSLGLIHQIGVLPEATYRFNHVLTQQVAYESLLLHRRKELHGAVGRAIRELYPQRVDENADILAHHFSQAEQWELAANYGSLSAQNASKLGQFSEALELRGRVQQWLSQLPKDPKRQELIIENLFNLERLCETLGKRERQQQILNQLRCEVETDRQKMAEVYRREGELMTLLGRFDQAQNALEQSLAICRQWSDTQAERNALRSLGFLRWHNGMNAEASQLLEQVIDLDRRLDDLQNTAGDLTSFANVLRSLGQHQRALECLQEALAIYERKPDPGKQATTMHIMAITYRDLKETDKALDHLKQACEFTAKHRLFIVQAFHLTAIANIYWQQGDLKKSLEIHQEALAVNRKSGHAHGLVQSLRIVGELWMTLGNNEEALPYLEESAVLFSQLGDEASESQVRMSAAGILEQQQRYVEALDAWMRVRELKKRSNNKTQELEALESLGRISRQSGAQPDVALQYYKEALALAEELQDISAMAGLLNSIGILYWGRGEYSQALAHYERALKIFENLNDPVHTGLMLNSIGVTLIRLERWQSAEDFLQRAIRVNAQTNEQLLEAHAWAALGELWYKMDKKKEAVQCYEASLGIRRVLHDQKGQGWMLYYLAKLHKELGSVESSENFLSEAMQISVDCADQKLQQQCRILQNLTGENDA